MHTRTLGYFLTTVISCTTATHALCQQAKDETVETTTQPKEVSSDKVIVTDESETAEFRRLMDRIIINHDLKIHESFGDWEVTCDNLGTCRAAGYQEENERQNLFSILIVKQAPSISSEPAAYLQIITNDNDYNAAPEGALTFFVDGKELGGIKRVKKNRVVDSQNRLDELFLLTKK